MTIILRKNSFTETNKYNVRREDKYNDYHGNDTINDKKKTKNNNNSNNNNNNSSDINHSKINKNRFT